MEISPAPASAERSNGQDLSQMDSIDDLALKKLLADTREQKAIVAAFKSAVESSTYHGSSVMAIAKGISFLEAVLMQTQAHIANLQAKTSHGN